MQSLVQFVVSLCLWVIAFLSLAFTAAIYQPSVIGILYFSFFSLFVGCIQGSVSCAWRRGTFLWTVATIVNLVTLGAQIVRDIVGNPDADSQILLRLVFGRLGLKHCIAQIVLQVMSIISAVAYVYVQRNPIFYRLMLAPILDTRKHMIGRCLLIFSHRHVDAICAIALACFAAHWFCPLNLPLILCAVVMCSHSKRMWKTVCCCALLIYIPVEVIAKCSFDIYGIAQTSIQSCDATVGSWISYAVFPSGRKSLINFSVFFLICLTLRCFVLFIDDRHSKLFPQSNKVTYFPEVDCRNSEESCLNVFKFLLNYFFYKFGYEICLLLWFISALASINEISLLSISLLMIIVMLERRQVRRFFIVIIGFHIVVFTYHYIANFEAPALYCTGERNASMPWKNSLYAMAFQVDEESYMLRFTSPVLSVLFFLNILLSIRQRWVFQIETNCDSGGGSNDGAVALFEEGDVVENPVANFYLLHRARVVDKAKQEFFSYFPWLVLLLEFANGIRLSAPTYVSLGHAIFALVNLWRGNDLYLCSIRFFRFKWCSMTFYVLFAVFVQIFSLVAGVFIASYRHGSDSDSLFVTLYLIVDKFFLNFKSRGVRGVREAGVVNSLNTSYLVFDAIVFAAFLIQLRIIVSWHFQHTVLNIRADRMICLRRRILLEDIRLKQLAKSKRIALELLEEFNARLLLLEKIESRFGRFMVETIRGWNVRLLIDSEAKNPLDSTLDLSSDDASPSPASMSLSRPMVASVATESSDVTIEVMVDMFSAWLGEKTLNERCVSEVVAKEKDQLIQRLPAEMKSLSERFLCTTAGLGLSQLLATDARTLLLTRSTVQQRWLKISYRFVSAVWWWLTCNTELLSYIALLFVHAQGSSLLTLPLPLLVLFWGALYNPPSRTFWIIVVFYVDVTIVITMTFNNTFGNWGSFLNQQLLVSATTFSYTFLGKVFAHLVWVSDNNAAISAYSLLVVTLFMHRHIMRRYGFWWPLQNSDERLTTRRGFRRWFAYTRRKLTFPSGAEPYDYYGWMVVSDLCSVLLFICNYSSFDFANRDVFSLTDSSSYLIPTSFLYFFAIFMLALFLDRILYLTKSIRLKFIFFVVEVIATHVYVFGVMSFTDYNTHDEKHSHCRHVGFWVVLWYLMRCVHMLASAYQIHDGYPDIIGHSLSMRDPISWLLCVIWFHVVPLFEIGVILDWTFTKSALAMLDFYAMEVINYNVHFINGFRKFELFYAYRRGEPVSIVAKALLGGTIVILIIVIVFLLLLSVSERGFVALYLPQKMDYTLRISNHSIFYQVHLQDLPTISKAQFEELKNFFRKDDGIVAFIDGKGADSIVDVTLPALGEQLFAHPTWEDQLIRSLGDVEQTLTIRSRLVLERIHLRENADEDFVHKADLASVVHAKEWEMPLTLDHRRTLLKAYRSQQCGDSYSINVTDVVPSLLTLPPEGPLIEKPNVFRGAQEMTKVNHSFRYFSRLVVKPDCSLYAPMVNGNPLSHLAYLEQGVHPDMADTAPPRFIFIVSKVSASLVAKMLSSSSASFVMVFVMLYLTSSKVRELIMQKPSEFTFREMGDPWKLIALCGDVFHARCMGRFEMESNLYGKIVFVVRSPEALICFTRYQIQNILKPKWR